MTDKLFQTALRRLSDGTYVRVQHVDDMRRFVISIGSVENKDAPADQQLVTWRFEVNATPQDVADLLQDLSRSSSYAEKQTAAHIAQQVASKEDAQKRLADLKRPI